MNYVLKNIIACFSILFLVSCSSDESPSPQPVSAPVTVPEPEPVIETTESDTGVILSVSEEVSPVEDMPLPITSEPTFTATTDDEESIEIELQETQLNDETTNEVVTPEDGFRANIVSAVAYVCPRNYGAENPCIEVDTSSCISEVRGQYRICTNRLMSRYPGAIYSNTDWSTDHYEDKYYLP